MPRLYEQQVSLIWSSVQTAQSTAQPIGHSVDGLYPVRLASHRANKREPGTIVATIPDGYDNVPRLNRVLFHQKP